MINLRETRNGVTFNIRVSPGNDSFGIKGCDSWSDSLLVSTSGPRERGKANREIEKGLSRLFGKSAEIISGKTAKNKVVLVRAEKKSVERVLEKLVD